MGDVLLRVESVSKSFGEVDALRAVSYTHLTLPTNSLV